MSPTTALTREANSQDNVLVVFGGLLLVMLLAALDSTIVATALPTIVSEFGELAHISWVVTAYLLAQTIAAPIYGKLGDLYGRKRVLQFAIVLFLVGSALCGLSRSMFHLIIFRNRHVRYARRLPPLRKLISAATLHRHLRCLQTPIRAKGKVEPDKLKAATRELLIQSLIEPMQVTDVYVLNDAGCEIYSRLAVARREKLAELWPEWSPRKREEVADILRRLARELIPEPGFAQKVEI